MKKNMGLVDRILRILLAVVIAVLYFTGTISGTITIVLGVMAIMLVLTSFLSFCPLYVPCKLSTVKKDQDLQD